MKKSRVLWATLMLLVVAACLLSVPAFGENPWDADGGSGGGGGTGTPLDSTDKDVEREFLRPKVRLPLASSENDGISGWISRATIRVSFFMLEHFSFGTPQKAQGNTAAY